jgi:hypothetical protein
MTNFQLYAVFKQGDETGFVYSYNNKRGTEFLCLDAPLAKKEKFADA